MNSTISMHCYFCEQTSPEGSLFCKHCGSPFHLAPCPRCAAVNALTAVSCYKCKAILPIRRAETKAVANGDVKIESLFDATADKAASKSVAGARVPDVVVASESTPPVVVKKSRKSGNSPIAKINAPPVVDVALPVDVNVDDDIDNEKTIQPSRPPVETHDEIYQKTIVLPRTPTDVDDVGYQKTIPVRRPAEKVHDEDYQKTIVLQRAYASASASAPASAADYDVNYPKTIALQRTPVDIHNEAYVKTISTRHPPASLVGGAVHKVAAMKAGSLNAMPTDLQAEYAALQSIDVIQKAKWGQRALLASAALLLIVAGAYFFLRSQQRAETSAANADMSPDQLQTEALARLPATVPGKVLEPLPLPLPLNVKPDAANQATNQAPKNTEVQTPPSRVPLLLPLPAKAVSTAAVKPSAPAANQQTKASPNDRVLLMPPDATKLSAAATAAAIAAALGKDAAALPGNKSDTTKLKPDVQVPTPANLAGKRDAAKEAGKNTANPALTSQPPAPCTEALAALGLCVLQPTAPKP